MACVTNAEGWHVASYDEAEKARTHPMLACGGDERVTARCFLLWRSSPSLRMLQNRIKKRHAFSEQQEKGEPGLPAVDVMSLPGENAFY